MLKACFWNEQVGQCEFTLNGTNGMECVLRRIAPDTFVPYFVFWVKIDDEVRKWQRLELCSLDFRLMWIVSL